MGNKKVLPVLSFGYHIKHTNQIFTTIIVNKMDGKIFHQATKILLRE
jgi:hypothetical protein